MSDPMQNLNDAADALNQVAARAAGFYDDADTEIAARQAAYDGLSANLKGLVNAQMTFSGTVDLDNPAPTNINGGTFNSIKSLIDAAPAGAHVTCHLLSDKTYTLSQSIAFTNQFVMLHKSGSGPDPIFDVEAYESDVHNNLFSFVPYGICGLKFHDIDVRLPTAEPNPAKPWSSMRSIVQYQVGMPISVALSDTTVTGGIAGVNLGVMSSNGGATSFFSMRTSTLDGPIFGVVDAADGVTTVAKSVATFANGAAATTTATLGTNLLEN